MGLIILCCEKYIFGHSDDQIYVSYIWTLSTIPASQLLKPLEFPDENDKDVLDFPVAWQ